MPRPEHGQHRHFSVGPSFVSSIRSSAKRIANNLSPQSATATTSIFDSVHQDSLSAFPAKRHSTSTSSQSSRPRPQSSRAASISSASPQRASELKLLPSRTSKPDPITSSFLSSQGPPPTHRSLDDIVPRTSDADSPDPIPSLTMAATATAPVFPNGLRPDFNKPPGTAQSNMSFGQGGNNAATPTPSLPPAASTGGMQNPNIVFQQIHDVSSKRISTLDYLRKAHEGRVYWFNTLLFGKSDLSKMPFFEPRKLARKATNYLLLGLSIPNILDLSSANPQEYLRALNTLLSEFESYQQIHSPEGGSASSLSRARLPSMFKRAAHAGTKGRRTSSATDIGLPISTSDPADLKAMSNSAAAGSSTSSFPASEQDLLPGEEYTYLLTPSLPFDPDFFETFATLCDVLIDCYTKVLGLISSPTMCAPGTGDMFGKADARLRKIMLQGIIKEFEDASRAGAKAEFAGLGKVVLGGLM